MPEKFRKWLRIIPTLFLLVACSATPSTAGNPATPVIAAATSTQTLFPPTQAPSITPTFTPTPTFEPPVFGELEINLITDLSLTQAEYDQTGWPTSISMPADGIIFYAIQCENMKRVKSGFFKPQNMNASQAFLSQTCTGEGELLLVSPASMIYATSWLDGTTILKEEYLLKKGMAIDYMAFDGGSRVFLWYNP